MTEFVNKCEILSDLWLNYRDDENFEDFFEYNDLGLPLAYMIANQIVDSSPRAVQMIDETFSLLLEVLELEDDEFESLDEMLDMQEAGGEEPYEEPVSPPAPPKSRFKF